MEPSAHIISTAYRQALDKIELLATHRRAVRISGPTGTGKEHAAQAYANAAGGKMVKVNCAALSSELARSALFGHVRGSFTGAIGDRKGAIEEADGGVLFLDEVAKMPLDVQGLLLEVLDYGTFCRVGETKPRETDVLVVSAAKEDLVELVDAGSFLEDLYHRLGVEVRVPSLDEQPEVVTTFVVNHLRDVWDLGAPDGVCEDFAARPWRGGFRELRNAVDSLATSILLGEQTSSPSNMKIVRNRTSRLRQAELLVTKHEVVTTDEVIEMLTPVYGRRPDRSTVKRLLDRCGFKHSKDGVWSQNSL